MRSKTDSTNSGNPITDLVRSTANSLKDQANRSGHSSNTAGSSGRRAIRGRPFVRREHPSKTTTLPSYSKPSEPETTSRTAIGNRKPLASAICTSCTYLTKLYHTWKTSKCNRCTMGGHYFPHYAVSLIAAAASLRQETVEQIQNRSAALTRDAVLARRDIDSLQSRARTVTHIKPTKRQQFASMMRRRSP